MKHFAKSVNSFFLLPSPFPVIPLFRKLLRLIGEANYSKALRRKQGFLRNTWNHFSIPRQ